MTVSELRKDIYNVVKHVATRNEPVTVINKVAGEEAILVSVCDWEDVQETL
jgi:prevent-host-death family protein